MNVRNLFIIIFAAIVSVCALYAPQPVLPIIAKTFNIEKTEASLLMTLTLIPFFITPVFYGFLLNILPSRVILTVCMLLLFLTELFFYFSSSFLSLLIIRLLQGFLIPAVLTSAITFISKNYQHALQRTLSIYISSTLLGGFLGRFLSGLLAGYLNYKIFFLILAFTSLVSFFFLTFLKEGKIIRDDKVSFFKLKDLKELNVKSQFIIPFVIFFVFTAILNYIPFRMFELKGNQASFLVSFLYVGYLAGIISVLSSTKLIRHFGSEKIVIIYVLIVYLFSCFLLLFSNTLLIFSAIFMICGCMFLTHAAASGYINRASNNKGLANGIYVSVYYAGAAFGAQLPGLIYARFGWNLFLIFNITFLIILLMLTSFMKFD